MSLVLENVSTVLNGQTLIYPTDLELSSGTMNVLLGPTSAGKTSLMRLMAGLDVPTSGKIFWDSKDVTGMRVQDRGVAMVYQQFINYPSMSVYDNIASPMRLLGKTSDEIDKAVRTAADLMKLSPFLDRKPLELSGGQQQRCALARALVKDAGWCCWMNRWRTLITNCAKNCAPRSPRFSRKPVQSLSMPPQSRKRRCCSVVTRPLCGKGGLPSLTKRPWCTASRLTQQRRGCFRTRR